MVRVGLLVFIEEDFRVVVGRGGGQVFSEVLLFEPIVAVKDEFFVLFPVWEETFPPAEANVLAVSYTHLTLPTIYSV